VRIVIVALLGAAVGLATIWFGFSLRLGLNYRLSGAEAYLPAAIVYALIALLVDYAYRKWWPWV